jgi:hypothetical protein
VASIRRRIHSLTLGILNGYRSSDANDSREYRSRGLLLADLAPASGIDEVEGRIHALDVEQYRSFRLVALDSQTPVWVAEWDRERVEVDRDAENRLPLISSSFEETEVGRKRREEYARATGAAPSLDLLEAFHRSHANGPSAHSVCMHRPNASTRSLTRVDVSAREVCLRYHAGAPCQGGGESTVLLQRAASC